MGEQGSADQAGSFKIENFEGDFPLFSEWARRNNILQIDLLVSFLNKNNVPPHWIVAYGTEMQEVSFAVQKYFSELD